MVEDRWVRAKAQMIAHLPALPPAAGPFSLSASYEAETAEAADQLAAWWRAQLEVAVRVEQLEPTTWRDLDAAAAEHQASSPGSALWVEYRDKRAWRVVIEGPRATGLSAADVEHWFGHLDRVPAGPRWQLTGVGLNDGWPAPDSNA